MLRELGPGLIIAGAIVGSGELIATTKVGAETGFWLIWLILLGCVIKVFTQIEFGRYAVSQGRTTLEGLNEIPGPRLRVGWPVWGWFLMTLLSLAQMGGIVGGVGQALAIAVPLTDAGVQSNLQQEQWVQAQIRTAMESDATTSAPEQPSPLLDADRGFASSYDAVLWAGILAVPTAVLLVLGRYSFIQIVSTLLVGCFTCITLFTLLLLQGRPDWAISATEWKQGFRFRLPPAAENLAKTPLSTALAAFGIIGVGAAELVMYPYWCLEKGYARWTGKTDGSTQWQERARGWLRVMRWDAWFSFALYTLSTLAFLLLGAAVLHRVQLNPEGDHLIRVLAEVYRPVFGSWAPYVFLGGAIAVLYSTYFISSAGLARVCADALVVFGLSSGSSQARLFWTRFFGGLFPILGFMVFVWFRAPDQLILAAGVAQACMLPVLGGAALYFRYRRTPNALKPGIVWDILLWLSFAGFVLAGGYLLLSKLFTSLTG